MANNKKMTKREMFEQIKAKYALTADEQKFIDHELELLAKKNSAEKKPTAAQVANEGIKEVILNTLAENGGLMTITDMQKSNETLGELSNQKISALVRQLIADNKVEKIEDKRKSYFKAVEV